MRRQQIPLLPFLLATFAVGSTFAQETPGAPPSVTPTTDAGDDVTETPAPQPAEGTPAAPGSEPADVEEATEESVEPEPQGDPSPPSEEPKAAPTAASMQLSENTEPKDEKPPYDGPAPLLERDQGSLHVGGYGGISIQGTSINGEAGLLVGGEGALLLGHRLAIGGAGYGLASETRGPDLSNGDQSVFGFGYGGAVLRYHLMSKKSPVTASIGTLVGAGGLTLVRKTSTEFDYEYEYDDDSEANAFFVAEPAVQVNLHLTKWMRIGLTGGYRFVRGPSLDEISDGDLEGVTAGGHVQFGWF